MLPSMPSIVFFGPSRTALAGSRTRFDQSLSVAQAYTRLLGIAQIFSSRRECEKT
jgi:hypothetical protein